MTYPLEQLQTLKRRALMVAVAGVVVCAVIAWNEPQRFWSAYLNAFLTCWLVSVGAMGLLALGNLTGGRWAAVGRPFYLAAMQNIWLASIAFIPIGVFAEDIFPWAPLTPGALPPGKSAYLEIVFFCERAAAYFIVWLVFSWLLSIVTRFDAPPASTSAMRRVGAMALVLLVPTATFAAFDWGMSLEPEWYSSIYGALLSAGGVLAAHALAIIGAAMVGENAVACALCAAGYGDTNESAGAFERDNKSDQTPTASSSSEESPVADVYNDLGNLLLAFLMVNTYFALSQFLIIWSGNLPSEITWYLRRLQGGWQWLALGIAMLHFALPFCMLLSCEAKRAPKRLQRIALLLLAMFVAHQYWMIVPAFDSRGALQHVLNLAALAALVGAWLAAFAWNVGRHFAHEQFTKL